MLQKGDEEDGSAKLKEKCLIKQRDSLASRQLKLKRHTYKKRQEAMESMTNTIRRKVHLKDFHSY